jgi:hypothetical protein
MQVPTVPTFLVEAYVPRTGARDAQAMAREARAGAEALTLEGTPIAYIRATCLPEDETCFHVFEAASWEAVAEVCRRAGIGNGRIVQAVE